MNNKEYLEHGKPQKPKVVIDNFKRWKKENNITERCAVHHRDDTEETRKYNSEHYERWGCNEDGTFEYGKYVIFMTQADHARYHHKGKAVSEATRIKMSASKAGSNSPMYGKHHSEETCTKISANNAHYWYGKNLSEEHRAKISAAMSATHTGTVALYAAYKNNGGILKWNEFRTALKNGEITFEVQPITVYTK